MILWIPPPPKPWAFAGAFRRACCAVLIFAASVCTSLAWAQPQAAACAAPVDPRPDEFSGVEIPAGQIDAAIAEVDALARDLMVTRGIPGMAIAVVRDGRTVFARGYGVRSVDTQAPVDADTVFQLASLSKSIGATVIARQVGLGVVSWDQRVRELMPGFTLSERYASDHATIGDLYAHRSGLPEHVGDLLEDLGFDRMQVLERLRYVRLAPYRSRYAYTNFGLTAAAEAVAVQSGRDWETLSQDVLYRPLGMNSTSSRYAEFLARSNRAVGHVKRGGSYVVSVPARDPDAQSAADGVSASVNDMARWMNMVLADGCVDAQPWIASDALLPAVSPQSLGRAAASPRGRAGFYGYGFNVGVSGAGRVVLSHSGAFALGAATAYTMIPSAKIGIVTLTNSWPIGVPETLNALFADLVQFGRITQPWNELYAAAFSAMLLPTGKRACVPERSGDFACPSPPADARPSSPLAHYAGSYANPYYGDAQVFVSGGTLQLRLGPKAMTFPLTHWSGDVFLMIPPGESATPGSRSMVGFAGNKLIIEYLNMGEEEGLGVFRRMRGH